MNLEFNNFIKITQDLTSTIYVLISFNLDPEVYIWVKNFDF